MPDLVLIYKKDDDILILEAYRYRKTFKIILNT